MKIAVFWDFSTLTAVMIYKTTRRHIPEDSNLQVCQTSSIHLAQDVGQ
jgi:hypothetical protein